MKVVTTQAGKGFAHEKKAQQSSLAHFCPNDKGQKGSYNKYQEFNTTSPKYKNQIINKKIVFLE
jgi:hypothetical protein